MIENVSLMPTYQLSDAAGVAERFIAIAREPSVRMALVRLSISRAGFLDHALLVSYRPAGMQPAEFPAARRSGAYTFVSRAVFRQQIGSELGKRRRWYAETVLLPRVAVTAYYPQRHSQLSGCRIGGQRSAPHRYPA